MRRLFVYVFFGAVVSFAACGGGDGGGGGNSAEEICGDGLDNDEDGQTDCDDAECANLFECKNPPLDAGPAVDAGAAPADSGSQGVTDTGSSGSVDAGGTAPADGGSTPQGDEICDDGVDNDGDLMTDCADEDCYGVGSCPRGPEDCEDGEDNNGDGLVDCADPLCQGDQACGGGGATMPCQDLVMCITACPDAPCQEQCATQGSQASVALAQALIACDTENGCQSDPGCLEEHCADQAEACQQDMLP